MNDQLFNSGKILLDITALLAFPINDLSKKEVCLPTKKSLLKKEGNSVCHVYRRPRPKDFVSIIELCQRHISADPYTYLLYPYIHYFLSLSSCLNYCSIMKVVEQWKQLVPASPFVMVIQDGWWWWWSPNCAIGLSNDSLLERLLLLKWWWVTFRQIVHCIVLVFISLFQPTFSAPDDGDATAKYWILSFSEAVKKKLGKKLLCFASSQTMLHNINFSGFDQSFAATTESHRRGTSWALPGYYEQHFRSIQSIECLECVPLEKAFALHNFWYRGAIDMQQTFLTFFFGYYTTTFLYHIDLSNPEVT